MVAVKDNSPRFTPAEYFAWEEQQLCRHEYIGGEVYAMSGGSRNHSRIAVQFTFLLEGHLQGNSCETGNSDLRVNILETTDYTYPDVSVTCDDSPKETLRERDKTTTQYITYPCLILEVLSDSTEAYDRGNKFYMYRRNPHLQDYVLVSSKEIAIDLYRKNDAGEWTIINYRAGDIVELKSINLSFPLAEPLRMRIEQVYREIVFAPESE